MSEKKSFHWFVSSAFHWRTGYNLRTMLVDIHKQDKRVGKLAKDFEQSVSIWRVPGEETIKYEIEYFQPRVEGALYCGSVDIADGLLSVDSEEDRTMTLEKESS